jgi:hypothetical protein
MNDSESNSAEDSESSPKKRQVWSREKSHEKSLEKRQEGRLEGRLEQRQEGRA